ncbi:hypothetical protein C8R43DRAFT_588573 [Mycena crocata]|nr:hypothetical protein C8R43DRAFT_588573 [Mycena crocata]
METTCDNPNCVASPSQKTLLCSGCSTAKYCSQKCQIATWPSHKEACKFQPPPSLAGIRVRVEEPGEGSEEEYDDEEDSDSEYAAQKIVNVKIEHIQGDETVAVGSIKIQVIEIAKTRRLGFFDCLDEYSHELGKLALHFDAYGRLRPNQGCWRPADFQKEPFLIYIELLEIEASWRGKGLGTWLVSQLFHLEALKQAKFMFTWPTVLMHLEPPSVNGMFGDPTPEEEARFIAKRDRNIKFFQKIRFRRLANSFFFCLAKNKSHPSHSISVDDDAPFKDLHPADTKEEEIRRYMANH